jgi:membrane dipeptidase
VPYGPIALKKGQKEWPNIEDYADNIDYIAQLVGSTENIGIGTDFCLGTFPPDHHDTDPWGDSHSATKDAVWGEYNRLPGMTLRYSAPNRYIDGFNNYAQVLNLVELLKGRGYKDEDISGILGENWLRIFGEVWK